MRCLSSIAPITGADHRGMELELEPDVMALPIFFSIFSIARLDVCTNIL